MRVREEGKNKGRNGILYDGRREGEMEEGS